MSVCFLPESSLHAFDQLRRASEGRILIVLPSPERFASWLQPAISVPLSVSTSCYISTDNSERTEDDGQLRVTPVSTFKGVIARVMPARKRSLLLKA